VPAGVSLGWVFIWELGATTRFYLGRGPTNPGPLLVAGAPPAFVTSAVIGRLTRGSTHMLSVDLIWSWRRFCHAEAGPTNPSFRSRRVTLDPDA
jgi:hypothetical protein